MLRSNRLGRFFVALAACAFLALPGQVNAGKGGGNGWAQSGKAVFDVNLASPQMLVAYLSVIKATHYQVAAEGLTPDFIIAIRGMAVTFFTLQADPMVAALVTELDALGVRFEICSIAMGFFGLPPEAILPEIQVVLNTFLSLIEYQNKYNGYALILIQ